MRLDHVSYAASHDQLLDVVQRIGSSLGAGFSDGGRHPRFGTQNFVLPLAGGTYLEVVAALDHPSADRAPFGRAVRRRADDGGGWLGWVVSVDDISPVEQRLGRSAVDGNRHRPDGFDLQWKQIGVNDLIEDPQLPFFIQWMVDADQHPSAGAKDGVRIARLEIAGSPERVEQWLGSEPGHPLGDIEVDWVEGDEPGLVAVTFATPGGDVRID
ncbi:MAG: VOC family protein [Motilibacteraceae bacterium]